jgi:hypothetical protein
MDVFNAFLPWIWAEELGLFTVVDKGGENFLDSKRTRKAAPFFAEVDIAFDLSLLTLFQQVVVEVIPGEKVGYTMYEGLGTVIECTTFEGVITFTEEGDKTKISWIGNFTPNGPDAAFAGTPYKQAIEELYAKRLAGYVKKLEGPPKTKRCVMM